jgi:hypothetical protein
LPGKRDLYENALFLDPENDFLCHVVPGNFRIRVSQQEMKMCLSKVEEGKGMGKMVREKKEGKGQG